MNDSLQEMNFVTSNSLCSGELGSMHGLVRWIPSASWNWGSVDDKAREKTDNF